MSLPRLTDPIIGVICNPPRRPMLMSMARDAGLAPHRFEPEGWLTGQRVDAVLLDGEAAAIGGDLVSRLKTLDCPVFVFGKTLSADAQGSRLVTIADRSSLEWVRPELLVRRRNQIRAEEFEMRRMTSLALGRRAPVTPPLPAHVVLSMLPGARFLALQAALRVRGARVSASLVPESLFLHMSGGSVSLAIFDLEAGTAALENFLAMRAADPRLDRIRVAVIRPSGKGLQGHVPALDEVDHISAAEASAEAIAISALDVARREDNRQSTVGDPARDAITGLASRVFFEQHLSRQMDACRGDDLPLTLVSFRLRPSVRGNQPTLAQFAASLARHLRAEELAVRLDWRTLAVSLRGADYQMAVLAAARLFRCLVHEGVPAEQLAMRVVEKRHYHDASTLLATAMSGPFNQAFAA